MPNLGAPELIIIAIVVIALFGWKRLPDMARSLGRSARVFKSEVDEMKKDGKSPSEAAQTTVAGDVVESDAQHRVTEAEAEARAAQARSEADRFRSDPSL